MSMGAKFLGVEEEVEDADGALRCWMVTTPGDAEVAVLRRLISYTDMRAFRRTGV